MLEAPARGRASLGRLRLGWWHLRHFVARDLRRGLRGKVSCRLVPVEACQTVTVVPYLLVARTMRKASCGDVCLFSRFLGLQHAARAGKCECCCSVSSVELSQVLPHVGETASATCLRLKALLATEGHQKVLSPAAARSPPAKLPKPHISLSQTLLSSCHAMDLLGFAGGWPMGGPRQSPRSFRFFLPHPVFMHVFKG